MKNQWHQINTRRISLQMCLFWNDGFNKKEFFTYGIGITKFLQFFDGIKTQYYVDKNEWEKYRDGQRKLLEQTKWVKTIPYEAQTYLENQLKRFSASFPKNLETLTNQELLALQRKVASEVGWTNSRTWMIYLINDLIVEKVRLELNKIVDNKQRIEKYLLNFSTPLESNDAIKERVSLLELKLKKDELAGSEFDKRLEKHRKRFEHIPMFGFDHKPFELNYFKTELEKIDNPVKELHELQNTIKTKKEIFEKELSSLNLKPTDKLLDLILMLKHTVFVRDYRDTLRQQMYLLDRYMYEEIGKRLGGLTPEETCNLTNVEIDSGLKKEGKYNYKAIAKHRTKGFLIIQDGNKIKTYSGNYAFSKAKEELGLEETKNVNIIQGIAAAKGVAQGKARIIQTNHDLKKIQPGDIMITSMTRQDFVPAIRRCVAIITDEGGITNHAAIISREFNIPCVVGAKIAVNSLKDGQPIQVDGDKGLITKII